ncbi:MAG: hypothetical protein Q8P21_00035, partial [bacterium]|nr:hypothetical protein [bacterium]
MKILIATGLGKSDIGGPAQYGLELKREFEKLGHEVRIAQFGSVESALLRIWPATIWADACLALDTFSVGMPSVLAGKIFGKKVIVRVGGDFLWSAYVNRTGEALTLPKFYERVPELNVKEKLMRIFMRWTIEYADYLAFNTEWQRSIWSRHYGISESKTGVVRNF